MSSIKNLWRSLAVLLIASFGVLLWTGADISQKAPPMPEQVLSTDGKLIYSQSCVYCHGERGTGGEGGGAELTSALTVEQIIGTLSTGKNSMPNFRTVMTVEQMHDIATYLTDELLKKE